MNGSFLLQDKGGDEPAIGPVHWLLAAGLILVSFISLASAFWANHARSIYLKDGPALVPEKWGLILVELTEFFKLQHTRSQASLASLQDSTKAQAQKANDLLESFLTLQQALSDRDAEIARLKKGYDAKIFKRFLQRFIRVDRSLAEMEQDFLDPEHAKNYRFLKRIMEDALEECGVEKFIPELGFDYREAGPQIGEDPNEIQTEDEKQDFRIARVDTAGYVLKGEGDLEVIVPSKVTIFRMGPSKDEDK